jgi:hypothetical protein
MTPDEITQLQDLEDSGDYPGLIASVRERVAADCKATLADPWVQGWLSRRFRWLFLDVAMTDPAAVTEAADYARSLRGRSARNLPPRAQVAARFLRDPADDVLDAEQPPASALAIRNTTLVLCPGLLNGLMPVTPFERGFPEVAARYGMKALVTDSHPFRTCDANTADILDTLEHGRGLGPDGEPIAPEAASPPGDVVLIGYSKGMPDILHLLQQRPDIARRVRAVVGWAGAQGGSVLADELLAHVPNRRLEPEQQEAVVRELAKPLLPGEVIGNLDRRRHQYDVRGAFQQLLSKFRNDFWQQHAAEMDALDLPWFYVAGFAEMADVPYFHALLSLEVSRHDRDHDMQITHRQAVIPLPYAVPLATFHADHWDIVFGAFPEDMRFGSRRLANPFPTHAALLALVAVLAELGLID